MKPINLFILPISILFFSHFSMAQLALDPNFGEKGYVVTTYSNPEEYTRIITTMCQSDNKIIALGYKGAAISDLHNYYIRYNPNGKIDSTFGENGVIDYKQSLTFDRPTDGIIDSSGNFYVVGVRDNENANQEATIIKYNREGSLQTNFGNQGLVSVYFNDCLFKKTFLVENNTKLLVAGQGDSGFLLARFSLEGKVDSAFGINGFSKMSYGLNASIWDSEIQTDNKIIAVGGATLEGGNLVSVIARFHANGLLDKSFGDNGIVTHDFLDNNWAVDFVRNVDVVDNGDIILAGISGFGGYSILKLKTTGEFDSTFATNGIMEGVSQSKPIADNSFVVLPTGEMVSIYIGRVNFQTEIYLTKYKANGEIDSLFQNNGVETYKIPNTENTAAVHLNLLSNNKILLAGYSNEFDKKDRFTLIRLMPWLVGLNAQAIPQVIPVIYPNPSSGEISFKNIKEPSILKLYNSVGQIVLQKKVANSTIINTNNLPTGLYKYSITNTYLLDTYTGNLLIQ